MRVNWTDDRLGERFDRIDERFDDVDERFRQIGHRFDRVDMDIRELRGEVKWGLDRIDARFDTLQRTLFLAASGIVAALIGLIGTQL